MRSGKAAQGKQGVRPADVCGKTVQGPRAAGATALRADVPGVGMCHLWPRAARRPVGVSEAGA